MTYIFHHTYKGLRADGKEVVIPFGTELEVINNMVVHENALFCYTTSDVAQHYLSRNDDGQGLLRGKYVYSIAFRPRQRINSDGHVNRFTEKELEEINNNWTKFIRTEFRDVLIFNNDFFNAEIEDLEAFAKAINIKIDSNYVYKEDPDDIFEEHQYFVTINDKPQFTLDANENENIIFQTGE